MSKKQYCDFCGTKIDLDCGCEVAIYDNIKESDEFQADVCDKCKKKIVTFLKSKELNSQTI